MPVALMKSRLNMVFSESMNCYLFATLLIGSSSMMTRSHGASSTRCEVAIDWSGKEILTGRVVVGKALFLTGVIEEVVDDFAVAIHATLLNKVNGQRGLHGNPGVLQGVANDILL